MADDVWVTFIARHDGSKTGTSSCHPPYERGSSRIIRLKGAVSWIFNSATVFGLAHNIVKCAVDISPRPLDRNFFEYGVSFDICNVYQCIDDST